MFIGTHHNSIDGKYRMIIPAKFRDELGLRCVLTLGIDKCIYIYPISQWEIFMEKLATLPTTDMKARKFARSFTGNAEECEIDRQGRITIPQQLREKVGITKELTTIGCMNKIEVWAREEYFKAEESVTLDTADIAEGMEIYGI